MTPKLPRPSTSDDAPAWRSALSALRLGALAEAKVAQKAAETIHALPRLAKNGAWSDPDAGPPPTLPNPQEILRESRQRALRVGAVTAGVGAWKESWDLYQQYKAGEPVGAKQVWGATSRVGRRSLLAYMSTQRRHLLVVGLDTAARVLAWQSARRAGQSLAWRALHKVSKNVAGRASLVILGVEVFQTMWGDLRRYREGELSEQDFYRNCALTGVSLAAPIAGSMAGPVGGTVGLAVSIGAGMLRK